MSTGKTGDISPGDDMKNESKCEQIRGQFLDGLTADAKAHLDQCAECARAWIAFEQTLKTLDAWQAPEPSPFFQTRLRARLEEIKAEEAARGGNVFTILRRRWFGVPVWRPAMVAVLTVAFAVGTSLYFQPEKDSTGSRNVIQTTEPQKGSAVGDLQALEKHQDAVSDLELLDDLPGDRAANGNAQDEI